MRLSETKIGKPVPRYMREDAEGISGATDEFKKIMNAR